MARVSIPIIGLGCGGGGAFQVERALARLGGVEAVYVNPANETAYVDYDPSAVSPDALLEEVRRTGYRPGPVFQTSVAPGPVARPDDL